MAVTPELILVGIIGFLLLSALFERGTMETREIIIVQPPAPRSPGCLGIILLLLLMLLGVWLVSAFGS